MKNSRQSNRILKITGVVSVAFGLVACQQLPSQTRDTIPSSAFHPDGAQPCALQAPPIIFDLDPFDGDGNGVNDLAVFRPPTASEPGHWYWRNERDPVLGEFSLEKLGVKGDWLVPNDYDGPDPEDVPRNDGSLRSKSDIAIYRPPTAETGNPGEWWIAYSNGYISKSAAYSSFKVTRWGINDPLAQPVPADYDADGKADLALWQPSTGNWKVRLSRCNADWEFNLGGQSGDQPLAFDFDGDRMADPTIFNSADENHPAHWRILESHNDYKARDEYFGDPKSESQPANYDGDEKVDIAVYSLTDSLWHIKPSSDIQKPYVVSFGYNSDIRIPGYYTDNGDNFADFAVFRPKESLPNAKVRVGYWYVLDGRKANQTSDMIIAGPFGLAQDIPLKVYQIK